MFIPLFFEPRKTFLGHLQYIFFNLSTKTITYFSFTNILIRQILLSYFAAFRCWCFLFSLKASNYYGQVQLSYLRAWAYTNFINSKQVCCGSILSLV